jgi:hypothetical protein
MQDLLLMCSEVWHGGQAWGTQGPGQAGRRLSGEKRLRPAYLQLFSPHPTPRFHHAALERSKYCVCIFFRNGSDKRLVEDWGQGPSLLSL